MKSHIEAHVENRSLRAAFLALAVVATLIVFWPWARRLPRRESAPRSLASSHLRQIGQANLIYASDHHDMMPIAENVWDYAGELARDGGLNDATVWLITNDPANPGSAVGSISVLGANRNELDPAFRKLVPSWAVPLGKLSTMMPSTTPIAWTRGLQPDGTWASHSPNGTKGGHVVFLGGNVAFFENVRGALHRYDGQGTTSNILEALPPGTRIGEYVPSRREETAWTRAGWMAGPVTMQVAWLVALATLITQIVRGRWPAETLMWFSGLSFVAWLIFRKP